MKRMLEGDGSVFERGLLDSLKTERPSAELEQRMRAAIGLGAVPSIPPAAPPPIAAGKPLGGFGSLAAGAVAAALFVGGALVLGHRASPTNAQPSAPAAAAPVVEPRAAPPVPAAPEADAPRLVTNEPETSKPRPSSVHVGSSSSAQSQSLREEIRLIDAARVAVKDHDGAGAKRLLDQYAHRFPDGSFREEARVLRQEAQKIPHSGP